MTSSKVNQSFSVTKVRVAFECPRLFYLGDRLGGPMMFLPPKTIPGIGKAFHSLCETCVEVMVQQPAFQQLLAPAQPDLATVTQQLKDRLYKQAFFPALQAVIQSAPKKVSAYRQLWQGLNGLIEHWAQLLTQNRQHCTADTVISKTFLAQELMLSHDFELPNGSRQQVRGKFDSLLYDFEQKRLCVADYKTYQPKDGASTLAQVALYGYMLKVRVGLPINSAVYSVLPDWKAQSFDWDELEATFNQLIPRRLQQMQQWLTWEPGQLNPVPATVQPGLCAICPRRKPCRETFGATAADAISSAQPTEQVTEPEIKPSIGAHTTNAKPPEPIVPVQAPVQAQVQPTNPPPTRPSPTPETAIPFQSPAEETARQLVKVLNAFKVGVDYTGAAIGPAFMRVRLKPHLGVKVSSVLKLAEDLKVQMGIPMTPMIAPQAGYISVDLPRPDRQTAHFSDYVQPQNIPPTEPVKIAIGVDLDGQLLEADLSDPNTCHFLVGGTTGSGKSEFLRSLLLSLLIRHSPDHLKIVLVDPKRVTFPEFENIPWLYQPVVKDSEAAIDLMDSLVAEMDRRYRRFEKAQCSSLKQYNKKAAPLPRIVCIFDEYADFMAEKEVAAALEQSIKRLGAMARAAGIHLIIATQRPEAKVVTPLIRSNLPGRVALRTASDADSMIILGGKEGAAAQLLGKGDLLYLGGSNLRRLQSLFASDVMAVLH